MSRNVENNIMYSAKQTQSAARLYHKLEYAQLKERTGEQ